MKENLKFRNEITIINNNLDTFLYIFEEKIIFVHLNLGSHSVDLFCLRQFVIFIRRKMRFLLYFWPFSSRFIVFCSVMHHLQGHRRKFLEFIQINTEKNDEAIMSMVKYFCLSAPGIFLK